MLKFDFGNDFKEVADFVDVFEPKGNPVLLECGPGEPCIRGEQGLEDHILVLAMVGKCHVHGADARVLSQIPVDVEHLFVVSLGYVHVQQEFLCDLILGLLERHQLL